MVAIYYFRAKKASESSREEGKAGKRCGGTRSSPNKALIPSKSQRLKSRRNIEEAGGIDAHQSKRSDRIHRLQMGSALCPGSRTRPSRSMGARGDRARLPGP